MPRATTLVGTGGSSEASTDSSISADSFVGAWVLDDWRTTNEAGEVAFPFGQTALGQIIYSSSGRMTAMFAASSSTGATDRSSRPATID